MLPSEAEADDAIQDAFVHVLVSHGQFRGDAKASTWVHRIAVNAALMQLRRGRRRRTESLDALDDDTAERVSAARQPLYDNEGPDRAAALTAALAQLGSVDRAIVVLRLRDEWTTKEVGAHLGLSVAAVKARLHRVRKQLSHGQALAAAAASTTPAPSAHERRARAVR
jgi:RNA polymerase sigma-70 factor (ECF subfamily)